MVHIVEAVGMLILSFDVILL